MVIKRKDFQKAAAFIHEFLLKLSEDVECAEVRDTLNLALLHMQKYYRLIQNRSQEKNGHALSLTARGLSPMTPFFDAPDKFIWRWVNLENTRNITNMTLVNSLNFVVLPPLINAAKSGDIELLSNILMQDPSCTDCCDGLGRTAVMYAVHYFRNDALEFLLEHKADINAQAHDESTAMHRACHDSNHIALKLLVEHGGDFTICDVQGRAPIHWAVTTRSTECLQILLAHGASVGTRDKDMLTPSMWACRMDNINHFELLCRAENNKVEEHDGIERDANGRTWMHWSVRRTQPLECLQTLLTSDSAAIKDKEGKTVLLVAAEIGSLHACRVILDIAGEKCIQDQDNQGHTALHIATMGGHGDVVNFLLEKKADVNVVDNYNATAWDYARIRKLHYCQLIIMSHQRQRMSNNPLSPPLHGLGLLMQTEEIEAHDEFTKMIYETRSNQSTPITPPHPPKRPRSTHFLVRRANSLTSADIEKALQKEQEKINSSAEISSMSVREEQIGRILPDFQDENNEIIIGEMDMSDVENEVETSAFPSHALKSFSQRNTRPRPPPRSRPEYMRALPPQVYMQNVGDHSNKKSPFKSNMNNNNNLQQQPRKLLQQQLEYSREYEEAVSESPVSALYQKRMPGSQQVRPQARVPPTPIYRQSGGVPFPAPPTATPQRPHMIRQQKPLPNTMSVGPQSPQQQTHELPSSSSHDVSPHLSISSPEPQQYSSESQGDRIGVHQPPGIFEGFRRPPPALSPLQSPPKVSDLDMFDHKDKKKRKKKREMKRSSQKPENPSDISAAVGFAAPLHPHLRDQSSQGYQVNSAGTSASKHAPTESEFRYVDENIENDGKPPAVYGFALHPQDDISKLAKSKNRSEMVTSGEMRKYDAPATVTDSEEEKIKTFPASDDGNHVLFIPPPPSFRGVPRSGAIKPLSQSVPQDDKGSRIIQTSGKPPLPKNRNNASLSSSQPPSKRVFSGYKSRSFTS